MKFLGAFLDENLTRKEHIKYLEIKTAKTSVHILKQEVLTASLPFLHS